MQELNFRIREAFQNGIRREPTPTANVAYLERCMNLVPREGGLATVPTFSRPGPDAIDAQLEARVGGHHQSRGAGIVGQIIELLEAARRVKGVLVPGGAHRDPPAEPEAR